MTGQSSDKAKSGQPDDRKSRLAEALRENLKRRKAQARDRREIPEKQDKNKGGDQSG